MKKEKKNVNKKIILFKKKKRKTSWWSKQTSTLVESKQTKRVDLDAFGYVCAEISTTTKFQWERSYRFREQSEEYEIIQRFV